MEIMDLEDMGFYTLKERSIMARKNNYPATRKPPEAKYKNNCQICGKVFMGLRKNQICCGTGCRNNDINGQTYIPKILPKKAICLKCKHPNDEHRSSVGCTHYENHLLCKCEGMQYFPAAWD